MSDKKKSLLDLEAIARKNLGHIHRNLTTPQLIEEIVRNREGHLAHLGPVVVRTGHQAECSLGDKFIVAGPRGEGKALISEQLREIPQESFDALFKRLLAYSQNRDIYVQDCYSGADPDYSIPIRVVTETAWHNLFARNMLRQVHDRTELASFHPAFTIVHVPNFQAIPEQDGTRSSAFVVIHPAEHLVLIGGTSYAGELRQAAATITNFLLPSEAVLPLRCAVNLGNDGDVAAFLGRTGNGKTALASDPERRLVGDHEHGWTDKGMFTYEWGCYAKVFNLERNKQPQIFDCTRRFGTILENATLDHSSRRIDLEDPILTTNIRACYPITHMPDAVRAGTCGHPKNIFLLTRDTTGVLPPIARLTHEQAVFAFLTAHASSLHETEAKPGDVKPVLTSDQPATAGARPRVLKPHEYAKLFMMKLVEHDCRCWFMNTGWLGEPQGRGDRIGLEVSRALIRAALAGDLDAVEYEADPLFQFEIPMTCPGVEDKLLNPRNLALDEGEYEVRANQLASAFIQGFERFGEHMPKSVQEMVANVVLDEETLDVMERFRFTI